MAHLTKSILINAPFEQVHALARDPKRWATWYVGLSEPETVTGEGGVGTVVKHSMLLAGIRFAVTSTVLEDHIDSTGGRWRGKIDGPMAGEHTFTLTPKHGDTEVTVEMEYTIPGKLLGKIVDRLIIERMMERNIEHTLENLKLLCAKEAVAV